MNFYKRNYKKYSGFWIFKKYKGEYQMAKKVYCSRCECVEGSKGMFGGASKINCVNSKNVKTVVENTNLDWYEEPLSSTTYDKKPAEINKNNDCAWYIAKEAKAE
jgi:hypothetical protein